MRLLSLAALVALSTSTCMQYPQTAASPTALTCRIELQAPAGIRFVLANPSQAPVWVLKWNTPLEGWMGSIFTVTGPDGAELPYTGPMVKRGDPGRDEYVQIPPGGEVDAVVDLANVYNLSKPGRYRVQVTGGLADLAADAAPVPRPREQHQGVELQCGEVELVLGK
jgi:hypothetical protein